MIRLQQNIKPTAPCLSIAATLIINWLHRNNFSEYSKIEQLRALNKTCPAKALKAAADEIVRLINNSVIVESKEK